VQSLEHLCPGRLLGDYDDAQVPGPQTRRQSDACPIGVSWR
jgi:hypothetical protein